MVEGVLAGSSQASRDWARPPACRTHLDFHRLALAVVKAGERRQRAAAAAAAAALHRRQRGEARCARCGAALGRARAAMPTARAACLEA